MSLLCRLAILGATLALGACAAQAGMEGKVMAEKTIEQVLKQHSPGLMAQPGVVGVAQGLCGGRPCIRVFIMRKTPELQEKLPQSLEGYPVIQDESGEVRALPGR